MGFSSSETLTPTQSDNCTRANETPLTDGGNWGTIGGGLAKPNLVSDQIKAPNSSSGFVALWTGNSWANDQYSEITIGSAGSIGNNDQVYAVVRGSTSALSMYRGIYTKAPSGGILSIDKYVAGTQTALVTCAGSVVGAGDTLALAVIGSTLLLFHNKFCVAAIIDASLTSGDPGVGLFAGSGSQNLVINAWEGGTISTGSGGGAVPVPVPVAVNLAGGVTGTAYSETVGTNGGTSPYTYAVASGSLPTSLSLNTSTGVISGTPTVAGTYTFTITSTDANSNVGTQNFQIIVVAPSGGGGGSYTFLS